MRLTTENIRISFSILQSWTLAIYLINFRSPKDYLHQFLKGSELNRKISHADWTVIRKVIRGIRWLSPFFLRKRRCLVQSMVVKKVLEKHGIDSMFRVGAIRDGKKISTHAWIEINNTTIIGGPVEQYLPLIRTR